MIPVRLARVLAMSAAVAALVPVLLAPAVAAYQYTSYQTDYAGEELMRLTNMDRVALGKAALRSDPFLVTLARDNAFRCPSTASTVYGRSKSMASTGFFSHDIYGCKKSDGSYYTILDIMYSQFGYNTYRAENIAYNTYGVGAKLYQAGCDLYGANCKGPSTYTQETMAVAERGFMSSSGHRANILGNYDRFGCASWLNSSTNAKYYACIFSLGGPKPLDTTPPAFSSVSGSGITVSAGSTATFSASFYDNVRLAEGYVKLDAHVASGWAYSYNVVSTSRSVTISTSGLAAGAHTIMWAIRDVSALVTYRQITFYVR